MNTRQKRAVRALLSTRSVVEAAKLASVSERTLFSWLTEPAFRAALSEVEGELIDAATRRLLALQDSAIDTFERLLAKSSTASDAVRLRAAQSVLDYLLKLRELRNIETRLTALEQTVHQQTHIQVSYED